MALSVEEILYAGRTNLSEDASTKTSPCAVNGKTLPSERVMFTTPIPVSFFMMDTVLKPSGILPVPAEVVAIQQED